MCIHARWLKPELVPLATRLDDWLGHGRRNLQKKWWFDIEIVDGVGVTPKHTNTRDIDPARQFDAAAQTIAYYHADQMPPPDQAGAATLNRAAAVAAGAVVETPAAAAARHARGEEMPLHYRPTPARGDSIDHPQRVAGVYSKPGTTE